MLGEKFQEKPWNDKYVLFVPDFQLGQIYNFPKIQPKKKAFRVDGLGA